MAGGKETPRQKMIGMMYLVLLALLAMNVSKQIVMAFVTLNNKIESQNKNFGANNGNLLYTFQQSLATLQSENASEKEMAEIKKWKEKAEEVHASSKAMVNYLIGDLAETMLDMDQEGEWSEEDPLGYLGIKDLASHENDYAKKDSYDNPTRMMVELGKGKEMLGKIAEFRDSLAIRVGSVEEPDKSYSFEPIEITRKSPEDTAFIQQVIDAMEAQGVYKDARPYILEIYKILTIPEQLENHGEMTDWTIATFDHAPQVAAAAMMTSIKGQILQAEGKALEFYDMMNTVPPFKFDTIEPKAFARSSYINQGDSLNLDVMIAAYDSKSPKKVRVWVDDSTKSKENEKYFEDKSIPLGKELGAGIGDHTVYGEIEVLKKGVPEWKPFKFSYKIGAPASAIGNAEMNVMYVGYTNKIAATASGFPEISVTCSGCTSFGKADGDLYNATVSRPGQKVMINITGTTDDGKTERVAQQEFRVLPMPKPRVYVIGVDPFASSIARSVLASGYLRAQLIGSPLTITSSVTGGQVTVTVQGVSQTYPMSGNAIPAQAANIIRQLRPGATVMIETRALLGGKPITPAPIAYKVL